MFPILPFPAGVLISIVQSLRLSFILGAHGQITCYFICVVVVEPLSPANSVTPWTATHQTPLFSTVSQSFFKFIFIESINL